MPGQSLWSFALLILLTSPGCTRVERARQCGQLASVVNPRFGEIQELAEDTQTPDALRSVADRYDGIADDLTPLEFQSRALAEAVQEYGRHLRAVGAEARKAASAIEGDDREAHQGARKEIRSLTVRLRAAQRRIEEACR